MAKQGLFPAMLRLFKSIVLVDIIIIAVIGLACQLVHWDYGTCLLLVGALVLLIGVSRVTGHWGGTRTLEYLYGQSVGPDTLPQRSEQAMQEAARTYSFQFRMTMIGVIILIVGGLLQAASV
jgi:hypothetical protein